MALAFLTTPTLQSLGSFGYSKSREEAANPLGGQVSTNLPRSRSESVGAIIKCSDCGEEVFLSELGGHVCKPAHLIAGPPSVASANHRGSPLAGKLAGTSAKLLLPKNKLAGSTLAGAYAFNTPAGDFEASSMRRAMPGSSSGSSITYSDASGPIQPNAGGRKPFFEKYAQLAPKGGLSPVKGLGVAPYSPERNWASSSPDFLSDWPSRSEEELPGPGRDRSKTKVSLTPPTSPELSPERINFSTRPLQKFDRKSPTPSTNPAPLSNRTFPASDRRAQLSQRHLQEREESGPRHSADRLETLPAKQEAPMHPAGERYAGQSLGVSGRNPPFHLANEPSPDGLEDLIGDLMAEIAKKAETTSQKINQPPPSKHEVPTRNDSLTGTELSERHRAPRPFRSPDPLSTKMALSHSHPSLRSPQSPDLKPSDSISQWGMARSPSPEEGLLSLRKKPSDHACHHCGQPGTRQTKGAVSEDTWFCHLCYSELYLPKCRKCHKPIEKGAVTDRVGKVLGKYHASCFNCFECSAPFPNGDFYVWQRKPVCSTHYHRLAGTTCSNVDCGKGIEGPCVSLILGTSSPSMISDGSSQASSAVNSTSKRLYHPEHFSCSRRACSASLWDFHFVVNGVPWCERHAIEENDPEPPPGTQRPHPRGQYSPRNQLMLPPQHRDVYPYAGMGTERREPARGLERRRTVVQNIRAR